MSDHKQTSERPLTVLKFGGSVLGKESDLRRAAHECYRWSRAGHRVLAVVSALEGTTDQLVARADRYGSSGCPASRAQLIATGELTSASLLSLALARAGVPATSLTPAEIGLLTEGPPLDSSAVGLDVAATRAALDQWAVVVVPGFVGIDASGRTTLLGRGGSDLTALFLADRLGATACRLIKDVDGLYEFDPARPGPRPRRFASITWDHALALGGGIVQPKALRHARERGLAFEVAALHEHESTYVGAGPDAFARLPRPRRAARVAVLGAGTVGLGVFKLLTLEPERFAVQRVVVRDVGRARERGVPAHLLATDALAAAQEESDIVVEALGGIEPAREAVEAALRRGAHVVTANKALIAQHGPELAAIARASGASLLYSAAVGGAAPCLEAATRLAAGAEIVSIEGVLNGTTNAVLTALGEGRTLTEALADARAAGLCEADATRDLSGRDAADKLCLLVATAFGIRLDADEIRCPGVEALSNSPTPAGTRQVAWARRTARGGVEAGVELRRPAPGNPLGDPGLLGPENALVLTTADGDVHVVRGTGAGRWPTAQAVLADLLDLPLRRSNDATSDAVVAHAGAEASLI